MTLQISPFVQMVGNGSNQMVYHSLFGNPRVINQEGVAFLNLFKAPITPEETGNDCSGDLQPLIDSFRAIKFLVDPEEDERGIIEEARRNHLLRLSSGQTVDRMGLAISDNCNLGCPHCMHFQPDLDGLILVDYQKSAREKNMTFETAKKCIASFVVFVKKQGKNKIDLHFGNAEPLINWKVIVDVLDYCDSIDGVDFTFTINTNLVLLTREMAQKLKKHKVSVAVSLDGLKEANDSIRRTKGGGGTFDSIIRGFDLLEEIGHPLDGFSTTVTKGNFGLIDTRIIDFASERGMVSMAFDYDLVSTAGIPLQERVDKLMALKRYANQSGIDFFGTWDTVFRNLTSASLLDGCYAFCAAVEGRSLEFAVDGNIKVCNHATSVIGHVDRLESTLKPGGGLYELAKGRFPGTDPFCYDCEFEGVCGGQCHVSREAADRKGQGGFTDLCGFYRLVTRALIEEYVKTQTK